MFLLLSKPPYHETWQIHRKFRERDYAEQELARWRAANPDTHFVLAIQEHIEKYLKGFVETKL